MRDNVCFKTLGLLSTITSMILNVANLTRNCHHCYEWEILPQTILFPNVAMQHHIGAKESERDDDLTDEL